MKTPVYTQTNKNRIQGLQTLDVLEAQY